MITRTEWQKFTDTVYNTCFAWTKRVRFDGGVYVYESFSLSELKTSKLNKKLKERGM